MNHGTEPDYTGAMAGALVALGLFASTLVTGLAAGSYDDSAKIGDDANTFAYSSYAVAVDDTLYQYATGADGEAYYATYDGTAWADWQSWDNQPAKVTYDPAPVAYDGKNWAFYTTEDGKIYQVLPDAYGGATWDDVSGDYMYDSAPYATADAERLNLYATGKDGNVYHRAYTAADGWGTWEAVNDDYVAKAGTEPYAVSWDGQENVFWTGEDGTVYWNRYGDAWTEAVALGGDGTYEYAPYAVGYAPEKALYAYSTSTDGTPAYNVFDGTAWAGWQQYDVSWAAKGQPSAYTTDDGVQHVAYTAADGHAYYTAYEDGKWSAEWQDLGENYASDTYQFEYQDELYLTYTGEDGSVYYREYAAADGSSEEVTPTPKY